MFKTTAQRRALLVALLFSLLTIVTYLCGGTSATGWFKITNTAHEASLNFGASCLLLFLIISLAAWLNLLIKVLRGK